MLREPEEFLAHCRRRCGDAFTVRLSLFSPDRVRQRSGDDRAGFSNGRRQRPVPGREGNALQLFPLGPDSVLLLDGERHARMRRFLRNLWHPDYVEVVSRSVRSTVDRWRPGERIYLRSETERIALDVSLTSILGLPEGAHRAHVRGLLVEWLGTAGDVQSFLLGFRPLMKEIDDVFFAEIRDRRRRGGRASNDLLSRLVLARDDDASRLTDREIRDQLVSLIAAGHDTRRPSWHGRSFTFHRTILARLRSELAGPSAVGR